MKEINERNKCMRCIKKPFWLTVKDIKINLVLKLILFFYLYIND